MSSYSESSFLSDYKSFNADSKFNAKATFKEKKTKEAESREQKTELVVQNFLFFPGDEERARKLKEEKS